MVIGKRGEKELQMIFGLFVLLIITLVVLNLFLNTAGESGNKIKTVAAKELSDQQVERVKLACEELCEAIDDENSAIEFCAKFQTLNQEQNKQKNAELVTYGAYEFCSTKVPCFILTEKCKGGQYTGDRCREILLRNPATRDRYKLLAYDPSGAPGWSDGCNMVDPNDPTVNPDQHQKNWKFKFGYSDITVACNALTPPLVCT